MHGNRPPLTGNPPAQNFATSSASNLDVTTPCPPLDYASPPKIWRRRRTRRIIFFALLAMAMGIGFWRGSGALQRARFLYWQHRCGTFSQPADHVAWDEDPAHVPGLLASHGEYISSSPRDARGYAIAIHIPRAFNEFQAIGFPPPYSSPQAVLFMHEMTSPNGIRRIVVVKANIQSSPPQFIAGFDLDIDAIEPGTWGKSSTDRSAGYDFDVMTSNAPQPPKLRIFTGQLDATDQSHFTIRYELDKNPGMLDGYLRDAGAYSRVEIVRRVGPNEGAKPSP
jgi:hypothetical protein